MEKLIFTGMLLAAITLSAKAADGISLELGSDKDIDMARIGMQWNWDRKWFELDSTDVIGYWDLSLGAWESDRRAGNNKRLVDVGITPVLRWQSKGGKGPYLEGGIGAHLISRTEIANDMDFGSSLQFSEHVGVGVVFGDRGEFDLAYRFQHLSNGGISEENTGIDFHQARLGYRF